ncbi:MAG: carbohydrate binding domain-containing protein [Thermoguttaceae bacterium]|nr:carbohydrate binding domain-containing protein [Thermoguttaceae bacterium]
MNFAALFFRRDAIRRLGVLCAFGFAATSFATDYYVDSKTGDDDASGRSPQTAWRSLERVSSAELEPGDAVYFKAGERWRGGLKPASGAPGKPVLYSSYGEGAKPSILRSVALDDERDWVKVGDNLWATRPTEIRVVGSGGDFLTGGWGIHSENGAKASFSVDEIDGVKTFRVKIAESGTAPNHVQWTNSPFKLQAGKSYRVAFDASASIPFEAPSVSLMTAGAPWSSYGSLLQNKFAPTREKSRQELVFKATHTADDARVTFYFGTLPKGCEIEISNLVVEELEVDALELDPDVGNIILDGNKAAFKRWTLDDLKANDDFCYERSEGRVWYRSDKNPALRFDSIEAAVMRHVVDLSGVEWAVFDGLDLRYGAAHGFGGSGNARVTIRNCDISWIGGGDQYREGGAGRRVRFGNGIEFWASGRDHLVENCRIWEVYDAAITNQGSGVNVERNIVYRNNLIWNCEYSFEYWNRGPESITENVEFVDNVCLNAGYGWGHVQRPDPNGRCVMFYANTAQTKNLVLRGNIFANATESLVRSDVEWTPEQPRFESNVYWQDDATLPYVRWLHKNYAKNEFDAWRQAVDQEKDGEIKRIDVESLIPKDVK